MTREPRSRPGGGEATNLFVGFLSRRAAGDVVDFERFCAENSELEAELRELEQHWEGLDEVLKQLVLPGQVYSKAGAVTISPPGGGDEESADLLREVLNRLSGRRASHARYTIRGEVGGGGMGKVLRVWDEDLHRNLAMKVVLREGGEPKAGHTGAVNSRLLRRFIEEAQVTGQLDHPGIVAVHELGIDPEGGVYFTMTLVAGRDLEKIFELVRTEQEGWNQTRAVGVLLKVCEAMAYAHSKRVIHRDIKPANVMVGRFGETYVMDWGLARVLGQKDSKNIRIRASTEPSSRIVQTDIDDARDTGRVSALVTMDGDIVGTPAYMSPEQARGDLEVLGPATDVYSIGAILYHLLTGHSPYLPPEKDRDALAVWTLARTHAPDPVLERSPDAPPELVAICDKAMARDPAQRYDGTMEVAEDLRAYLEGRVVRAYETGAVAEFKKWVVRNKELAVTAIGAIALLVGGSVTTSVVLAGKNDELTDANEERRRSAEVAERRAEQVLRLSDLTRLGQLEREAGSLWPAHPENVPGYEDWLETAGALVARLDVHLATLAELRSSTTPIPAEADARSGWRFERAEDQWEHDTLAQLVDELEAFADPETGRVPDVERRLAFARTVEERTLAGDDAAFRWAAAIESIADPDDCPFYDGLRIEAQIGLVPIGRDPRSGFWEFVHVQTGEEPERDPETGDLVLAEESGLVMVLLPGGTFWMGAQAAEPLGTNYDPDAGGNEFPPHPVHLDPFFLSKYEMTQAQWLRATRTAPSIYGPDTLLDDRRYSRLHPVEHVTWDECSETLASLFLELPTEAQWEYAARSGTTTPWWSGSEKETLLGTANLADRSARRVGATWPELDDWPTLDDGWAAHAPVDTFEPNRFGLFNVPGNVWEWCRDEFGGYDVEVGPGDGERAVTGSPYRVNRGGSFQHAARSLRSAHRNNSPPEMRHNHLGVRPARRLMR